jgi:predicted ester cyclase
MSEAHKAAACVAFDVWGTGDLARLDGVLSPDVVHHDAHDPHGADGLEGMKTSIARARQRYPDLAFTIADQIAEGDRVATRWRAEMTRNGRRVALHGITIDRFEHGRIVEAWRCMDMLGMLRQSGELDG